MDRALVVGCRIATGRADSGRLGAQRKFQQALNHQSGFGVRRLAEEIERARARREPNPWLKPRDPKYRSAVELALLEAAERPAERPPARNRFARWGPRVARQPQHRARLTYSRRQSEHDPCVTIGPAGVEPGGSPRRRVGGRRCDARRGEPVGVSRAARRRTRATFDSVARHERIRECNAWRGHQR